MTVRISDHQGNLAFFDHSKFDCIFFVFDISDFVERTLTFDNLWERFLQTPNERIIRIVVANKCDLIDRNRLDDVVSEHFIIQLARMKGIPFILTSAKTSFGLQNLISAFLKARNPVDNRNSNNVVVLQNDIKSENSGCNC